MHARRSSFKSELDAFRASRKPAGPDGVGNRNSADMQVIDRWLRSLDMEKAWVNIKRRAPTLAAADFIQTVLNARRSAVASVNRVFGSKWIGPLGQSRKVPGFNDEWAAIFPSLKAQLAQRLSKSSLKPLEVA